MFAPGCAEGLFINASPFAAGSHPPLRSFKGPHFSTVKLIILREGGGGGGGLWRSGESAPHSARWSLEDSVKRLGVRVKTVLEANGMEN